MILFLFQFAFALFCSFIKIYKFMFQLILIWVLNAIDRARETKRMKQRQKENILIIHDYSSFFFLV